MFLLNVKIYSLSSWSTGGTYTIHDTPPIKTLTSLGCPVLRLRPLIVRDEPPALGPLRGEMLLSTGSWWRDEEKRREIKDEMQKEREKKSLINNPIVHG